MIRFLDTLASMPINLYSDEAHLRAEGCSELLDGSGLKQFNDRLNQWTDDHCLCFRKDLGKSMACLGGIVVDRHQLLKLCDAAGLDPEEMEDAISKFVLAHERAHWQQMKALGGPAELEARYRAEPQLVELEADFLGACAIGLTLNEIETNFLPILPFVCSIGEEDESTGYPSPKLRGMATIAGLNFGAVGGRSFDQAVAEARRVAAQLISTSV